MEIFGRLLLRKKTCSPSDSPEYGASVYLMTSASREKSAYRVFAASMRMGDCCVPTIGMRRTFLRRLYRAAILTAGRSAARRFWRKKGAVRRGQARQYGRPSESKPNIVRAKGTR